MNSAKVDSASESETGGKIETHRNSAAEQLKTKVEAIFDVDVVDNYKQRTHVVQLITTAVCSLVSSTIFPPSSIVCFTFSGEPCK